jgi:arginine utilization protein RocB
MFPFIFPSSEILAELENDVENEESEKNVPPPPVPEVQRDLKDANKIK